MGGMMSKVVNGEGTPLKGQRMLEGFDPRSPSDGVPRTPIIVAVTPVQPSNAEEKLAQLLDPRSPSEEFKRTPIITPLRFDFSELEQALKTYNLDTPRATTHLKNTPTDGVTSEAKSSPSSAAPLLLQTPVALSIENTTILSCNTTPISETRKSKSIRTTPLGLRSPNVPSQVVEGSRGDRGTSKGLRHVAHHNRVRRRVKQSDENTPRSVRL